MPSSLSFQFLSLILNDLYYNNIGNQFRKITILLVGTMTGFSLVYASNDATDKTLFWDWIVQSLLVADWTIGEGLYMFVCREIKFMGNWPLLVLRKCKFGPIAEMLFKLKIFVGESNW